MLSKKTQLCVDVLVTMASASPTDALSTQVLSQHLRVSLSHLESILKTLRETGFVRSVRGPGGGYLLQVRPDQTSVWQVVERVEPAASVLVLEPVPNALIEGLEHDFHQACCEHLQRMMLSAFVKPMPDLRQRPSVQPLGFRLGPKPEVLRPVAPNSVFQLSAFMQAA